MLRGGKVGQEREERKASVSRAGVGMCLGALVTGGICLQEHTRQQC